MQGLRQKQVNVMWPEGRRLEGKTGDKSGKETGSDYGAQRPEGKMSGASGQVMANHGRQLRAG